MDRRSLSIHRQARAGCPQLVHRAPTLLAVDPAAGAIGIPIDAVFRLDFSEPVVAPVGSIVLRSATGTLLPSTVTVTARIRAKLPAPMTTRPVKPTR